MKKDIITVDKERGIVQVTTLDERWYGKPVLDTVTGLPTSFEYVPSVTWMSKYYPKGIGYMKWLAGLGWNEAEAVRQSAAEKGSRVHRAIGRLLKGEPVAFDAALLNPETQALEELTPEEYGAVVSFRDWWGQVEAPKLLLHEQVVWGDGYAGTLDLLAQWGGQVWLVDLKTSQDIWPEHEIQVTAYREALHYQGYAGPVRLGILQVGYRKNRKRPPFKFTEIAPVPKLFAAAREIWAHETAGQTPAQRDYPLSVSLALDAPPLPDKPLEVQVA